MRFAILIFIWSCVASAVPWFGGDVGTSLRLPDARIVWIYGDSFVGGRDRASATFVHNSVRIGDSVVGPMFNETGSGFDWPLSMYFVRGALHAVMSRVVYDQSPMGFAVVGTTIARVANWREPLVRWKMSYTRLPRVLSAAAVVWRGRVFLFDDASGVWELGSRLKRVGTARGLPPNSEFSVLRVGGVWYAVQMIRSRLSEVIAGSVPTVPDRIVVQTATSLLGPWSPARVVFEPPETRPGSLSFVDGAFAYAAKAHREMRGTCGLPFGLTYVVNTVDPNGIMNRPELYRPVTVLCDMFRR